MTWGENDLGEAGLAWARVRSPVPDRLLALVALSRKHFGWFTKQATRALEYPWIAEQIEQARSGTVLDMGAGVSPLPIYLAEKGLGVVTVDLSSCLRGPDEARSGWNEWGFLDYNIINTKIVSHNRDILSMNFPERAFTCIYSVSVIEHAPAVARRQFWERFHRWLAPEGLLLVTVDLAPGTDLLWNYNMGKEVDPPGEHGDVANLQEELTAAGFCLNSQEAVRDLPESRTDCLLLHLVRN